MESESKLSVKDISSLMTQMGAKAAEAGQIIKQATSTQKDDALKIAAQRIKNNKDMILRANSIDMDHASRKGLKSSLIDRLDLSGNRLEDMAIGLESIIELPDPVGQVIKSWRRPNGLEISQISVPLGVIGIIYESRPNVTADAGGLCLKSGNAVILRGGSESFNTSKAIVSCLHEGLRSANLPENCIQIVPTKDRGAVGQLLTMTKYIDVIVSRGGKSLVERVQNESRVPTIAHLEGLCHVYVDNDADTEMACNIVLNAKMRRTGVCGAAETLLIDRPAADRLLPPLAKKLMEAAPMQWCDSEQQVAKYSTEVISGLVRSRMALRPEEEWTLLVKPNDTAKIRYLYTSLDCICVHILCIHGKQNNVLLQHM